MYSIIYFSPTGNTKYLAEYIAAKLGSTSEDIQKLEFLKYEEIKKNNELVLLYPIHGFNAPRTVKRFVKNMPEGLFEKVHLIAVGCNNLWLNDAVSIDLRKSLELKGYQIHVDEILAMPLSFVMSFPEENGKIAINESLRKIDDISCSITNSENSERTIRLKSKFINLIGKLEDPAARFFGLELHAKKACTSCGICWNNCPENNILPNKNNIPKFGFSCMMCMRCIYDCPVKAITPRISKFIPVKGGYNIDKYLDK